MITYRSAPIDRHRSEPPVGVLVTNLGTPDAPTASALRPYLRQFLSDPRVIELPKWKWWPILYLFVLTRRPAASAEAYEQIWWDEGSPLLVLSRRQVAGLEARFASERVQFALGMRYGNPSIPSALAELQQSGCERIVVLPLYPQYSGSTVGSTYDAVLEEVAKWRWTPELRTIGWYHDAPGYVDALVASVREHWASNEQAEKLVMSFHGLPKRYVENGDPYHCHCHKTARLVAEGLGLEADRWEITFQSQFGREEWIRPATDETLKAMAKAGVRSVDVICPGFSADCVETLEEIDIQNREFFLGAGGTMFRYIPCLNDRSDHLDFLAQHIRQAAGPWLEDEGPSDRELAERADRFERLREPPAPADGGYGERTSQASTRE